MPSIDNRMGPANPSDLAQLGPYLWVQNTINKREEKRREEKRREEKRREEKRREEKRREEKRRWGSENQMSRLSYDKSILPEIRDMKKFICCPLILRVSIVETALYLCCDFTHVFCRFRGSLTFESTQSLSSETFDDFLKTWTLWRLERPWSRW